MDESEWAIPATPDINVVDVLDNFATEYPDRASWGFEIAGFVWWQGDKDRYDLGHTTRYEPNLVNLITSLRSYYTNRYPGKVVNNAPFVLATLGQTALDSTNAADKAILDAQLAVDGYLPAKTGPIVPPSMNSALIGRVRRSFLPLRMLFAQRITTPISGLGSHLIWEIAGWQ